MYDLLILSFNQDESERLKAESLCVKSLNQHGRNKKKYYYEIWPFINNAYGILYKIYTPNGLGEFECCDELFEFETAEEHINGSASLRLQTVENGDPDQLYIRLKRAQYDIFVSLLEEIMSLSPISIIAFLCRGQSLEKEIILGSISMKEFRTMLLEGEVKTNICYIVGK